MTHPVKSYTLFRLSDVAYNELVGILKDDIGQDALDRLSAEDIHRIGHHLLTLTKAELKIAIREKKRT